MKKLKRKLKAIIIRKINKFFISRLKPCKRCGYKGCISGQLNQWHVLCLGSRCTNHTELHKTKLGAIKEWNS